MNYVMFQDGAKAYMRNHNVPNVMQRRVQRWYDYAWSRSVACDVDNVLKEL